MDAQPKPDFRKVAAEALKPENISVTTVSQVRATLYQGDDVFAVGAAEVFGDSVTFFPEAAKRLESYLREPICLKVSGEDTISLLQPPELFQTGTDAI